MIRMAPMSANTGSCSWHWSGRWRPDIAGEVTPYTRRGRMRAGPCGPCPALPLMMAFAFFALAGSTVVLGIVLMAILLAVTIAGIVLLARAVTPLLRQAPVIPDRSPYGRNGALSGRWSRSALPTAGLAGLPDQNRYRHELLALLKERFVRGELTVAEFEVRAAQIARDASVRHLM